MQVASEQNLARRTSLYIPSFLPSLPGLLSLSLSVGSTCTLLDSRVLRRSPGYAPGLTARQTFRRSDVQCNRFKQRRARDARAPITSTFGRTPCMHRHRLRGAAGAGCLCSLWAEALNLHCRSFGRWQI